MTTTDALAARYDGPLPIHAAVSADADAPLLDQLANKRRWAWEYVRRLGREMVFEKRAFHETANIAHHRRWESARGQLQHAIRTWRMLFDWHAAVAARAPVVKQAAE